MKSDITGDGKLMDQFANTARRPVHVIGPANSWSILVSGWILLEQVIAACLPECSDVIDDAAT